MTLSPKVWLSGLAALIILLGTGAGYLLFRVSPPQAAGTSTPAMIKTATEVGSTDTKTFRDAATGVLKKDGLNGEGTHQLIRDGGPSQTVYLLSSIVDLDQFEGKKIEVWGETIKAQKVPWLMDVGRVKILE